MERKVYVKSLARISPQHPDPDYRAMFPVMEARRLSLLMKRAIAVSQQALDSAGVAMPDAIVTGTGLGCIENTEHFIRSLSGLSDAPLRPTHFMQSTHNTIGSLIAIRLHCHGYNATYSHGYLSFESALLDAFLQIRLGKIENALVGAFEEMTPNFAALRERAGEKHVRIGDRLSETAAAMLLTADPADALCELVDIHLETPSATLGERSCGWYSDSRAFLSERDEYQSNEAKHYGNNFCVSALYACDAIESIAAGGPDTRILENKMSERTHATLTFQRICGR